MEKSTEHLVHQSHRIGLEFLLIDVDIALTFLDLSNTTGSEETRKRNRHNALTAYDSIRRLLRKLSPSPAERKALQSRLALLHTRLTAMGYELDPIDFEPMSHLHKESRQTGRRHV